jgi:hypothetical protein
MFSTHLNVTVLIHHLPGIVPSGFPIPPDEKLGIFRIASWLVADALSLKSYKKLFNQLSKLICPN